MPRPDLPLAAPRPAEVDEVPAGVRQVERCAHRGAQADRRVAAVPDPRPARDDGQVAEDRVDEGDHQAAHLVGQVDLERLGLVVRLGVRRRQARNRGFAGARPMAGHHQLDDGRAIGLLDDERGYPVVAGPGRRVFEGDRIAESVVEAVERRRHEMPVRPARSQRRAEVQVAERAVLEDPEDVAELFVSEVELEPAGVDVDRHDQGSPSGSIVHVQRYVPGPTRYSGSVSGPQLAVPRPR